VYAAPRGWHWSVEDGAAPVFTTAPLDQTIIATSIPMPVPANDLGPVAAEDALSPPVTITNDAPAEFPVGDTTVTWTATDAAGNSTTVDQLVTIVDEPPAFSVIADCTLRTEGTSVTVGDWATDCPDSFDVSDLVDGSNVTIACDSNQLDLGTHTVSCTACDTQGNESAPDSLTVIVEHAYLVEIDRIKGNIKAGSTVPLDFRFLDPDTGQPIDSSGIIPSISWSGPFSGPNCTGTNTGTGDGNDSGMSDYRLTGFTWQFSWQTPDIPGSYYLTISPPGTAESSICVTLK